MGREPPGRCRSDASNLLVIDHLERITERRAALFLYLHDDKATAPPEHEIELVATDARVGGEESVAAKTIVKESAPLAPVHAAS